jgi:manganese-dependent inorganic pyrophosphatase
MASGSERSRTWEIGVTYVIGHQRPDTDTIGAALGYAWYLAETGQEKVRAARAGQPTEQTQFALDRFGQAPPLLLTGVAPTFGHAARRDETVSPGAPLAEALARMAAGERVVPVVGEDGKPAGGVTPMALARAYTAAGGPQALAQPCGQVVEKLPAFPARERICDHRRALLVSDDDDFLVTDDHGCYAGIATRGRILQPPRAQLVLVDHNELTQAISGADEADIVGVLDHHRLGNPQTAAPIPFVIDPVGSTSTLVAERCRARSLEPPRSLAGMLLSGILADTLVFRSPTTTGRDRAAAAWLAERAQVDPAAYGDELLRAAPSLGARPLDEILDADRKLYEIGGQSISIGQVEVTNLQELPHRRDELLAALEDRRQRENLAFIALMVTDVVMGRSRLLAQGDPRILGALPFARVDEHEFDLGPTVSRKKQLVPALYSALEEPR